MNKLVCILGMSGSGKSTIEKELERYSFKRVISYTTRPKREGEQEGVNYNYISHDLFNTYIKENKFCEIAPYREWWYGTLKEDIDLSTYDYVEVVNPRGYEQLIECFGKENIIGIYVTVNDKLRLKRSLERELNPDCKEICRRFISDKELFEGIESKVDLVVNNDVNLYLTIDEILKFIEGRE